MRGLVWFLVVAALAVALALAARVNEGFVLVVVPPYRVELSLALAVILVVAGFALVYSMLRLVVHTMRLPAYVQSFRVEQRRGRAQVAMRGAWQAYMEGRYGRAQRLAERAFELGETPGLAALLAARSAHFLRDASGRDLWLTRAGSGDEAKNARLVTQAELLLDERRFEEARGVLHELHDHGPKHIATLRMMLRAEQGLQNWDEVLRIVRQLEKRDAVTPQFARQLVVTATIENLRRTSLDADRMREFWRSVEPAEQHEPRVAAAAARHFIQLGDCKAAHEIIRASLAVEWNEELVRLYGECIDSDSLARLEQAEGWLREHPRDAALHLTLGRLCLQQELWGKARSYLEASLSEQPTRAAHVELARLLDRLGDTDEANRHYREATDVGTPA